MDPFDIFITYMSWDGGGKARPVLVFMLGDGTVDIYQITTQYEGKSDAIKAQYYKIADWAQAGLDRQSYIDIGTLITLSKETFNGKTPIGRLTESDKLRLLEFLSN
ncbi:MAG: hypothetical protein LBJ84_02770 [Oscillospiraceae bacterium]|jgi:hypothetical protein|nr:hypothetical protein [Oscillospiraceae bacterium]